MRFIGQDHIMNQLRFLLPDLYTHPERGANFLLRAPSGYGKTKMAVGICEYLAGKDFEVYLADTQKFKFERRVIFIDEVHKVTNFEILYPFMDTKEHVFVSATNADGNLPEAFKNRNFEYNFSDYDDEQLLLIAKESCEFYATIPQLMCVVEAGNRNPRVILSLISRLNTYFNTYKSVIPSSVDFSELLEQVFDIKDGLDTLSRRYMKVLEDLGGRASLERLKSLLHVDRDTLTNEIEPALVKKGLLEITQKGRVSYDNIVQQALRKQ